MLADLQLPAGFRFHPTDEELVYHYLCPKCASQPLSVPIIAEVDLYKFDPWQLPGMALYGEKEWFFFSPRDRKYPNGSRPNRAAGSGYWKATGADKPVGKPRPMGIKKALVFYSGKAPKGEKTDWIMHEYRLADVDRSLRKKNSLRLDDWVLCRIYNKKGYSTHDLRDNHAKQSTTTNSWEHSNSMLDEENPQPKYKTEPKSMILEINCLAQTECSDSVPRLHTGSSSNSGRVLSPELACDREVQSELKWEEWERLFDSAGNGTISESFMNCSFPLAEEEHQFPPPMLFRQPSFNEVLMYLQKPF